MPQHGATIQSTGPQNIAQTSLGLKGGDIPQNILVPDLLGTIELGRREEPELLFEQDITAWRTFVNQAAGGAGQFSMIELLNPPDVITVFWFAFFQQLANTVEICLGVPPAPALAAGTPVFPIDTRIGRAGLDASVPAIRSGTRAAIIGANILWSAQPTTQFQAIPVGPFVMGKTDDQANDNHFVIEITAANLGLAVNLNGYSLPRRAR